MAAPYPGRYTRAQFGKAGFFVQPRIGPLANADPNDPANNDVILAHAGWRPPFEDEDGEPVREDGVNLGELADEGGGEIQEQHLDGSGTHYRVNNAKGYRLGNHRHGHVDWRSANRKHVLSWLSNWDRYKAPGNVPGTDQYQPRLWYRGKVVGEIPDGGAVDDGRRRRVKGACLHTDANTGTTWYVLLALVLLSDDRADNDYREEVWMRRFARAFQGEATTDELVDEKIAALEEPGLTPAEIAQRREALDDELDKWIRVAELDTDALLPAPPGGDPKVAPENKDVAPWLFNASGNECQTIRMIFTGDGQTETFRDRQRLKVGLGYTINSEVAAGQTIFRPGASIASSEALATLTGTVTTTHVITNNQSTESREDYDAEFDICQGTFSDVVVSQDYDDDKTIDEDYTVTLAVDYIGDQEVFATVSRTRTYSHSRQDDWQADRIDRCGNPTWPTSHGEHSFAQQQSDQQTWEYDFNGVVLSGSSEQTEDVVMNNTVTQNPDYTHPQFGDIKTGPATDQEGSEPPDATVFYDENNTGVGLRWLDLRHGIIHYTNNLSTRDDDTDSSETRTKSVEEIAHINGTAESLQTDSDSQTTDNTARDTLAWGIEDPKNESTTEDKRYDAGETLTPNYATSDPRLGWDSNGDGVYLGSGIVGLSFTPYGVSAVDAPHGHETTFNRYDAEQSVQNIFGIQPVQAGDVFACFPVMFLGA